MPDYPERKPNRLFGYDYSMQGWYFVTICAKDWKCIFEKIDNGEMILNEYGNIVKDTWYDLPNHNSNIELDEFITMPNHIHGIIVLNHNINNKDNVGTGSEPVPTNMSINKKHHGLSEISRQFKTFSSRRINRKRKSVGKPLWQRSFYDHIIRNEKSLIHIREYIRINPMKWETDKNNPINIKE